MITNPILEDKWRVQKELSEQAGQDPAKYILLAHEGALEVQELYGLEFRYVEAEASVELKSAEAEHGH